MKRRELINLGYGAKKLLPLALTAADAARAAGVKKSTLRRRFEALKHHPQSFFTDPQLGSLARTLAEQAVPSASTFVPRAQPAPWRSWAVDVEPQTRKQIENAVRLPVAARAALMPDAHLGYGLPIGGVLATRGAVIPYAVGVDIACRMKLTVLDLPVTAIDGQRDRLAKTLQRETRFGIGAEFRERREHDVLDDDWTVSPLTTRLKDKAWRQLGTSGSGNHFVEFGELEISPPPAGDAATLPLEPGRYLALLSHSGSRGSGAAVCRHYSNVAMRQRADLPKELKHLAWLDLDSEAGQEYWRAMQLMGRYAAANHAVIHRHMARSLGADVMLDIENHHNFAWQEEHDGERLVVHRKGATPAAESELGIIPGSMATPAFIVRGRGEPASLRSAAHGAGRVMSRRQAKASFTWSQTKKLLAEQRVALLSADLDEVPMAYRDIEKVMAAQADLVDTLGRFFPRIVKMAPAGERPED